MEHFDSRWLGTGEYEASLASDSLDYTRGPAFLPRGRQPLRCCQQPPERSSPAAHGGLEVLWPSWLPSSSYSTMMKLLAAVLVAGLLLWNVLWPCLATSKDCILHVENHQRSQAHSQFLHGCDALIALFIMSFCHGQGPPLVPVCAGMHTALPPSMVPVGWEYPAHLLQPGTIRAGEPARAAFSAAASAGPSQPGQAQQVCCVELLHSVS